VTGAAAEAALHARIARLAERLRERGEMLATAESCTGGMIAAALTALPGSSAWYERGFVTYSNAAKIDMLGVARATLEREGAVSEATAEEMAAGAIARSEANLAVGVTGIAGPAGGSADKPVGTVCIGWCRGGAAPRAQTFHFTGDRAAVRHASVLAALDGLLRELE